MKKNNSVSSLSKFIAQAGICARRKATLLIQEGAVTVNDSTITEPGYKITSANTVKVYGQLVTPLTKKIYILLNKPKGYITTVSDEKGRRTVMELFGDINTRIYPIGRLDRNTTGLLLLTNDGYMAEKLSHPRNEIHKVYHVVLNRPLLQDDYNAIKNGIMLEDGIVTVDALHIFREPNQVEIELHSGRYRVIRRLFETLGYEIIKLDRTHYANLTKKGLSIGSWRYVQKEEINSIDPIE